MVIRSSKLVYQALSCWFDDETQNRLRRKTDTSCQTHLAYLPRHPPSLPPDITVILTWYFLIIHKHFEADLCNYWDFLILKTDTPTWHTHLTLPLAHHGKFFLFSLSRFHIQVGPIFFIGVIFFIETNKWVSKVVTYIFSANRYWGRIMHFGAWNIDFWDID